MIQALVAVGGWVSEYFKGKQEITKAKAKAEAERVGNWENSMADASKHSLKDEFWTIILAIPLIMCFCGDDAVAWVNQGFAALENMPSWYRYYLGIAIGAAFGVRVFDKWKIGK